MLEEIRMVQDDPEDLVQELHTGQVFGRHPLGRSILGREDTIRTLKRPDLMGYIEAHYDPSQIVIAIARQFQQNKSERLVARYFGKTKPLKQSSKRERRAPEVRGGLLVKRKRLEQVHLCLGLKGVAAGHRDRYAEYALDSILGGSISSHLFQEIAKSEGWPIPSIRYFGLFGRRYGHRLCGNQAERSGAGSSSCMPRDQADRQAGDRAERLDRAKNQMKGNLMLSLESSHSRMSKLAKDKLCLGKRTSLEEMVTHIDHITEEQVNAVGRQLFGMNHLAITGLGPLSSRALHAYR